MVDMSMTPFAKEQEQYKTAYREYQQNAITAADLEAQILKGLRLGEPLPELFLLAMEALAKLTHTDTTYKQAKEDLIAVYAYALKAPQTTQMELAAINGRIARMQAAMGRPEVPEDSKRRIEKAIRAHRRAAEYLTEK